MPNQLIFLSIIFRDPSFRRKFALCITNIIFKIEHHQNCQVLFSVFYSLGSLYPSFTVLVGYFLDFVTYLNCYACALTAILRKNISGKIKNPSKVRPDRKTLISVFPYLLSTRKTGHKPMPPCSFRDFAYISLFRKILSLMPCNISWGSSYIRVFILDIKIPFYLWWIKCVLKFRKTPCNYEKDCRSVSLVSWNVYSFAQSTTSI